LADKRFFAMILIGGRYRRQNRIGAKVKITPIKGIAGELCDGTVLGLRKGCQYWALFASGGVTATDLGAVVFRCHLNCLT
jgi:hypothetical protein